MQVRKPIIENKIYSEILLHIRDQKVYVTQLIDILSYSNKYLFSNNILRGKKIKVKSQPALREQLFYLKNKGYLDMEDTNKTGTKFDKNKKKFFIIWERIISDYLDYIVDSYNQKIKVKPTENRDTKEIIAEIEKRKDKFCNNVLVQLLFKKVFDDFHRTDVDLTIKQIFELMKMYNFGEKLRNEIPKMLELDYEYKSDYDKFLILLEKKSSKKIVEEFKIFDLFLRKMEYTGYEHVFENARKWALNHLSDYLRKQTKDLPKKSIEEARVLFNKMLDIYEKELKDPSKYFISKDTPNKIYEILKTIKIDYYYLDSSDGYYDAYCSLDGLKETLDRINVEKDLTGFDLFGAMLCNWILDFAVYYSFPLSKKEIENIFEAYNKYRGHNLN